MVHLACHVIFKGQNDFLYGLCQGRLRGSQYTIIKKWCVIYLGRKNTHFILGVKAKVELKLSIPIGAITEIIPKGFTLGVKEKKS